VVLNIVLVLVGEALHAYLQPAKPIKNLSVNYSAGVHSMPKDSLADLNHRLKAFAQARDWEQFHNPKNLSMAMIAECAELVEHFQWLTPEQSMHLPAEKLDAVALEMADILIFLIRCAERLDVDLIEAAYRKIELNEARYPADKVYGDARRASEYE
jgi:NTP pyrophosphatase (non-canonical NTP hydrolase)